MKPSSKDSGPLRLCWEPGLQQHFKISPFVSQSVSRIWPALFHTCSPQASSYARKALLKGRIMTATSAARAEPPMEPAGLGARRASPGGPAPCLLGFSGLLQGELCARRKQPLLRGSRVQARCRQGWLHAQRGPQDVLGTVRAPAAAAPAQGRSY